MKERENSKAIVVKGPPKKRGRKPGPVLTPEEKKAKRRERFQKWYVAKGSEYSEHRRQRYHEDPDYKDRTLQSLKDYREGKRKYEVSQKKEAYIFLVESRKRGVFFDNHLWLESEKEIKLAPEDLKEISVRSPEGTALTQKFVSLAAFSRLFGLSKPTVSLWLKKGYLPAPPHRFGVRGSWYPPLMLVEAYKTFSQYLFELKRSLPGLGGKWALFRHKETGLEFFHVVYGREYFRARVGKPTEMDFSFSIYDFLPETPLAINSRAYYTEELISSVTTLIIKYFRRGLFGDRFRVLVHENWAVSDAWNWEFLQWATTEETQIMKELCDVGKGNGNSKRSTDRKKPRKLKA